MPNPKNDPPPSNRWDSTHACYLAGRSYLDGADYLAAQMERHWGAGRLRLLVDQSLREKFDRQRYLLQAAVENGQLEDVIRESGRMITALNVLDGAARMAGKVPCSVTAWEVVLADGTVAAIVQDETAWPDVTADGRQTAIYTLAEVGRLLSQHRELASALLAHPGEPVSQLRPVTDPLNKVAAPTSLEAPLPRDELPW